jgi:Tfp pilus assembly protein PilF
MSGLALASDATYDHALLLYNKTDYGGVIHQLHGATDAGSLGLLGQAYLMSNEFRLATDTLQRAVTLDPTNSVTQDWLGRAFGRRAETAFPIAAIGLATHAREAFEKAVQLNPANSDAVNDLFEFYLQAPGMLGGGVDRARGLLPIIEKHDPVEVHFARARIHEQLKEFARAEAEYRKAMQMAPHDPGRIIDVAKFLASRGKHEESDRMFLIAEMVQPDSPGLMYSRADCWIHAGRNLEQARDLLNRYLASPDLTPEDVSRADAEKLLKKAMGN